MIVNVGFGEGKVGSVNVGFGEGKVGSFLETYNDPLVVSTYS